MKRTTAQIIAALPVEEVAACLLSAEEAGVVIGRTKRRVIQLIVEGRLPAGKVGREYVLKRSDAEAARDRERRAGRSKRGAG